MNYVKNLPLAGQKKTLYQTDQNLVQRQVALKTTRQQGYHKKSIVAIYRRTV